MLLAKRAYMTAQCLQEGSDVDLLQRFLTAVHRCQDIMRGDTVGQLQTAEHTCETHTHTLCKALALTYALLKLNNTIPTSVPKHRIRYRNISVTKEIFLALFFWRKTPWQGDELPQNSHLFLLWNGLHPYINRYTHRNRQKVTQKDTQTDQHPHAQTVTHVQ